MRILLIFLFVSGLCFGQTNTYDVSFKNAEHHEAQIKAHFPELDSASLVVRMSRSSPGRYALHEFAKNIYGFKATNSKGEKLKVTRPDPYSWKISGIKGEVNIEYTLFANRGGGTYSQIDQTHAHLNIPATFMYAKDLKLRPIEVTFHTEDHPDWKVATQLKELGKNKYASPDLYYFMDSPIEISDYRSREFSVNGKKIRFTLHDPGTEEEVDEYFEKVKKIVDQERKVYGELPNYDFGKYTFLVCYMPQASGDGMEHRNSTMITSSRSLGEGGMEKNIGTVAHEYFHSWNVERIRPKGLEPFDFSKANMSGELWFAEGFTSYYGPLTLCRAGIISPEKYVEGLNGSFNYVWNSPAREYFNPIEMSYQAPFVDAATSVDPVNRENTFISYYSYGSVLGLALDLKLREKDLNLDDFMKLMWQHYGKPEIPYTVEDIESTLEKYAGEEFADEFFSNYIYNSKMPNYDELFANVGLNISRQEDKAYFGASVSNGDGGIFISRNTMKHSPAYEAGLDNGDKIISLNGMPLENSEAWKEELKKYHPGNTVQVEIERFGNKMNKEVKLQSDPEYTISIDEDAGKKAKEAREKWLSAK
ncbi:MAG: PDZ domain-containing protein [Salegentibacter sp.]